FLDAPSRGAMSAGRNPSFSNARSLSVHSTARDPSERVGLGRVTALAGDVNMCLADALIRDAKLRGDGSPASCILTCGALARHRVVGNRDTYQGEVSRRNPVGGSKKPSGGEP